MLTGDPQKLFRDGKLVLASHNAGKLREIAELLEGFNLTVISAGELGLPEPEETGDSFLENAALKAKAAAQATGLPALADDSGLAVAALDGAPGIYSARWAGSERDFRKAMERVQSELDGKADRRAAFVCALCIAWPGPGAEGTSRLENFEGRIEGHLVWPPRGSRGFGYDPMFVADGEQETFGEMEPARKHAMSHRARAFRKLVDSLFEKSA